MKFLDNILRYPMFFFSSMIGLLFVLLGPLLKLIKELPNKNYVFLLLFVSFLVLFSILKQMLNLD